MPTKNLTAGTTFDRYNITLADLQALGAATSGVITLVTLPAGSILSDVLVKHKTALAGPSLSAATARATTAGKNWGTAYDVFQAASGTAFDYDDESQVVSFTTDTDLRLSVTTTGANLSALTAGEIDVFIEYKVLL